MSTEAEITQPEFTNGYESLARIEPGMPVWVELGRGRQKTVLPGVVKDHSYNGTVLLVQVDVTFTDLAGKSHIVSLDVRPVQLRRRETKNKDTHEGVTVHA